MPVDIDALVEEVKVLSGCTVIKSIGDCEEALEFLEKVAELHRSGTKISPSRVTKALEDNWDIVVSNPRISDHLRGACACRKTK